MTNAVLDYCAADALSADYARIRRRAIVSCAVGNFVELFDFLIFGLFAAQIGANFFPGNDPVLSLLSAFATYGVGFVMRPVGAIMIGAYGDLRGRKAALILTVGLMASATALSVAASRTLAKIASRVATSSREAISVKRRMTRLSSMARIS